MTVSPRYDQYKDAWDTHVLLQIKIGDRIETVRFFHCYKRGVDRVFVDHPMFLEKVWGKTGSKIYGPKTGGLPGQPNSIQYIVPSCFGGSDILAAAIPKFIRENVQIVVLGTGKKYMEKQLEQLEIIYPDKARRVAKFNVPLAHMIIAGSDFMLLPSRFEPCGLIQLHAMRYGSVPIVASTGGLVDTVKEGYTGFQMGAFDVDCDAVDPADVDAVATTVTRALATYGTPALKEMIQNCMAQDLSWKGPAKKWEQLLLGLEVAGSEPGIEGEEIAPLAKENVAAP